PDQNIIENAWSILEQRLNQRKKRPTTKAGLFAALQEEWKSLGNEYCESLYSSIPACLQALKAAHGHHTKY
ncbi:hypothetical protein K435DRAFT_584563, partial [Dendrothele bispora CBS 962.96]